MSEESGVIATAYELRAATAHFLGKLQERQKSKDERCADWIDWLRRRAGKLFKDAAALGRYSVVLDPPFQPRDAEEVAALGAFGKRVKPLFPGCAMWVNEEEDADGTIGYTIEISWAPPATAVPNPGGRD
jgi:hypothetical protein